MIHGQAVIRPDVLGPDVVSHATLPTPIALDGRLRVFLSGRDSEGRSRPYWVDLDPDTLSIVDRSASALLPLGANGTFDEDGVMPSSIVRRDDGSYRLYYIGWNRSAGSVPYRVSIGCAESPDGDRFERISSGPVLDRSTRDPIFVTTPLVEADPWTMLYSTCTRWEEVDGHLEPFYGLARATSVDGEAWQAGETIETSLDADAVTRPALLRSADETFIIFCHRQARGYRTSSSSGYRLAVGRLKPGRIDVLADDVAIDDEGLSSTMRCYPSVVRLNGRTLLLYNGNGFGETGVGAAWIDDLIAGWCR